MENVEKEAEAEAEAEAEVEDHIDKCRRSCFAVGEFFSIVSFFAVE
jgi:hypothetical protein